MMLSGEYNTQDMANPLVDFDIQASDIDIPKAFVSFGMLGKIAPIASKAIGKISLGMNYTSFLTKNMEPVMNSITGGGNLASKQIGIKGSNAFGAIGQQLNSDVFKDFMPKAVKLMAQDVRAANEAGKDVIWDQTSTTVKSRAKKFRMLPDYEAIAVVFPTPAKDELARRLAGRLGKSIPDTVIQSMIGGFEMPTVDEGFKEVWMT
jgi:hypothetical protein